MSSSYVIDRAAHAARLRRQLEWLERTGGPDLPVFNQPRPPRSRRGSRGETLIWSAGAAAWIGID